MGLDEVVWAGGYEFQAAAEGLSWYRVSYAEGHEDWPDAPVVPDTWVVGWVASGSGNEPFLELLPPRCPEVAPDLSAVTGITTWERLACFGALPLTLEGTWGTRGCGGSSLGNFEPRWLAYPIVCEWLRVDWPNGKILELRIPPDSGLASPTGGSIARVVGHFDDPAATTCTFDGAGLVPEIDPVVFELYCREQFVVESHEVIGTDPDFPP
jgi:hypothetical protein